MERADIELSTQLLPSAFAEFEELELPDLVTEGLGRPGNVAVCFGLDLGLVEGAASLALAWRSGCDTTLDI